MLRGAFLIMVVVWLSVGGWAGAAPLREGGREQTIPQVEEGRVQTGFIDMGVYPRGAGGAVSSRPDGSGNALFKYQCFVAEAMSSDRLQFVGDFVFLTDRDTPNSLNPVSFDYLLGMSTRRDGWRLQFDREEALTLRGGEGGWSYWDVRGSWLFGTVAGGLGGRPNNKEKLDGWSGAATAGYFIKNVRTPARLDGSGVADMRYAFLLESSWLQRRVLLRVDADLLTDRGRGTLRPVDMDIAVGAGTTYKELEFMLLRRSRESLDRSGYVSSWMLTMRKRFDSRAFIPPS